MATIGTLPNLADVLKRTDPDNKIATIAEILSETNEILTDALYMEGNLPTGHRSTVRTGLPAGIWRKLNQGVPVEKSTTVQVDDTTGMLEAYSEVDKALADLNGNTAQFRMSESMAFMEGMNQTFSTAFFFGDTDVNPERFLGLDQRFNALGTDDTQSSFNVIDAGGTGSDNTSAWFVTWGENCSYLIYPKGSMLGLHHMDKGQVTLEDASNNPYEGYRDHFKWDVGLCVRDWRGIARICNIDTGSASALEGNTLKLEEFFIKAWYRMRQRPGRKVIYCNEDILIGLHKRALAQTNTRLTIDQVEGKPVVSFLGVPIREAEALTNTESRIT